MWYQIRSFISFYFRANTVFNIQSKFLFDFIRNVLDESKEFYCFNEIEENRKWLKSQRDTIDVQDFGAGSKVMKHKKRNISEIAHSSLSNPIKCKILFNIVNAHQFKNIIELGTSLGISSAYLGSANPKATINSLEGDENISQIANNIHHKLGIQNVKITVGPFEKTLSTCLESMQTVDLAFVDGHHLKNPTLQYVSEILPYCHRDTIIIIDDIYWSSEMTEAWEELKSMTAFSLSMDLYNIGILFLNPDLSKQDMSYIAYKFKPWKIGLFG